MKTIFFLADANSIHTVKWVDYFISKQYNVHLATFAQVNKTKSKNVYFLGNRQSNVEGRNYYYLLYVQRLAKILKDLRPDYINAHYSYSMGLIALLAKKFSRVQSEFSVVCHGSDILDTPLPFIFNEINKFVLKEANKIFAVSDQISDKIKKFRIDEKKIFVGQYGIDIINNKSEKTVDIISNRTYNKNSRIDFLLEVIDEMNIKYLNIIFVLPTASTENIKKLKSKYPYITFYESIEYNKMQELISQSKVYISATKSDGTSLSLLEAMMMQCIPIVSNIVSNRSWILDSVNGYLFNNKEELKNKIKKALNSSKNDEMIKINKTLIKNRASYTKQMRKIEKFLVENI